MCQICRQTPCHPQCPNAEEEQPKVLCSCCDEPIYEGDLAFEVDGNIVCDNCWMDYGRIHFRWKG